MAFDSLYIAYAKAHYPKETYVSLIKFYTEKRVLSKVAQLKQEAEKYFGIKVKDRKFGQDNRVMNVSTDGSIYQALDSIKGVNREVGDKIYSIKDNIYTDCLDLYFALKELGLTKTQIVNLSKIDYFPESEKMIFIAQNYKDYANLKKDKLNSFIETYSMTDTSAFLNEMISKASKETEKMLKYDDKTIVFRILIKYINPQIYSIPTLEKRYYEMFLIGETLQDTQDSNFYVVEKYAVNRGSLLVIDKNNTKQWYGYKKNLNFKSGDIIVVNRNNITVNDKGWHRFTAVMNLTQMYKNK